MTQLNTQEVTAAWNLIQNAHNITLLTHYKPDGDGISACAALSIMFERMGKKVETIYPTESEQIIERHGANVHIAQHTQTPDLLIACDTSNYKRLYYPDEFSSVPLINIDHHISNNITGTHNFVDGNVSSTCELLYDLILEWDAAALDTAVAEALLFGMLYDTQVFQIQSTTQETLRVAAALMDKGADLYKLKTELLAHKNAQILHLWGTFLLAIQIDTKKKIAWAAIRQADLNKHGMTTAALVGFNNFIAQIADIDITMLLYETTDGQTKVSLRSKKADVNKLAATFGGGGHVHASGILSDLPIDELANRILEQV